jgi:hypothetical protein
MDDLECMLIAELKKLNYITNLKLQMKFHIFIGKKEMMEFSSYVD